LVKKKMRAIVETKEKREGRNTKKSTFFLPSEKGGGSAGEGNLKRRQRLTPGGGEGRLRSGGGRAG